MWWISFSAIVYYDLQKQTVNFVPDLRDIQRLETYPGDGHLRI